jgi:hypothetical protein
MNTDISTRTSHRIAAGVTAAYLRDLSRRRAPSPGDGRHGAIRRHRVTAAPCDRDGTGRRRPAAGVSS